MIADPSAMLIDKEYSAMGYARNERRCVGPPRAGDLGVRAESMGPKRATPQTGRAGRKDVQASSFPRRELRCRFQRYLRRMVAVLC